MPGDVRREARVFPFGVWRRRRRGTAREARAASPGRRRRGARDHDGHDVVVVDHSEEGGLQQKMEQQQHQRAPPFELYEPPQRRQVVDAKNQRDDDDDPRSRRPSEDDDDDQGSGPNLVVEEARPSLDSRALRSEFAEMSRVKHEARVVVGGVKPQYTSSSRTGYDARDWGRVLLTWPSSFVVRRIRSPLIAISLWSLVVACVHQVLVTSPAVGAFFLGSLGAAAPGVGISRTMTLAGSALSLLLVFRTNTAYNRYAEGRKVWERICAATRDCAEFCAVYVPEIGEARVKRIADLLVAFPLTLILYLQGQRIPYEPQDALEGAFHSVVKEGKIRRFQRRKRLPKILEETKSLLGRLFRQQRRRKATTRTMNAYIHQQRWLGLHAAPGRKREGHDGHDGHDDHSSYFAAAAAAGGGSTSSSLSSSSQFSSQQSPHHHTSRKEKKQRRQRRHSDFFSWTDDQHAEDIPKSLVDNAAQAQSRWRMDRDRGPKVPLDTFVAQCRRDDSLAACFSLPSDVEPEVALAQLHQLKFGRKRKPDAPVTLSELAAYYNPLALARLLTPADRARLARSRCPPLDVARQLTKEAKAVPFDEEKFTSRERMALITLVGKLRHAVGSAERIAQTPVPLHYARHALRFLSLWSLALPLALVNQLGFLTVPATAFIVWALFGLREIGTLIENPFSRPLQLQIVSDTLMIDVREAVDSINYYDSNHLHR
mmetsp:Transcript_29697/g.95761  ORF Transcript_29697/g.95761 Transcript_29697/m.95761 type:complete len:713 (-) Transcript_29697:586-2724(-)